MGGMFIITGEKINYFKSFSILRKNLDVPILLFPSFLMSQNVLILQTLTCLKCGHHLWTTLCPSMKPYYSYLHNKRAGPNKRAGRKNHSKKACRPELACRVEKIFLENKRADLNWRAGWNSFSRKYLEIQEKSKLINGSF